MLIRSSKAVYNDMSDDEKELITIILKVLDIVFQTHYYDIYFYLYSKTEKISIVRVANKCNMSRNKVFHDIEIINNTIKETLNFIKIDSHHHKIANLV